MAFPITAADFDIFNITIPIAGAAASLSSLIAGSANGAGFTTARNKGRQVMGVKLRNQAAAFTWQRNAAGQLDTVAAGADWLEPIGDNILQAMLASTGGATVAANAIVYWSGPLAP